MSIFYVKSECARSKNRPPKYQTAELPEKSAAPDAANVAFLLRATPHTAPLWPSNVPTQSPVSPCRSMGFPSRIEKTTTNWLFTVERKNQRATFQMLNSINSIYFRFIFLLMFFAENKVVTQFHYYFDKIDKQRTLITLKSGCFTKTKKMY